MSKSKATSTHAECCAFDPENAGGVSVGCFVNGTYVEGVLLEEDSPPPSIGCDLLITFHADGRKTAKTVTNFDLLDYGDRYASNNAGING